MLLRCKWATKEDLSNGNRQARLGRGKTSRPGSNLCPAPAHHCHVVTSQLASLYPLNMPVNMPARLFLVALRSILRNRGPYLLATAILALGIGMSVAMFSLVDAVLLRPLPFPRQESIHVIWKVDLQAGNHVEELAYPELGDLQNIRDFEYVAVMPTSLYGYARVLQMGKAEPVQIESTPVSHDFF